ncbi:MAG: transcription termination factor NusA [Candidatus Omnitrophica bacterium]|nr:transcription termination factor NusA [Candidatus Omnitrophota bacterium]MDD5610900.1 transcription termination factor NusA [Candidatus Omnitrophota bacterium]
MNGELLAILDQIEREKGIKKEVLIAAVEAAILTAARKAIDAGPEEEIIVELDRQTGKIRAKRGKEEITSTDFSRIAASTAKQVIIQKIREAEKEVVFNEFQAKVGEIVSGGVYRFERGNLIVDLLGKAEGILPRQEQSPKEDFKQGERIKAYCLEVRKELKGPQIILSRTHPNFVKKLFELEVPEIYEGIVEIRAISRLPGERTKIAVWSKNDKVDSVGACVGMRGSRVKNIVSELHGEKIDIVPWNDTITEYIKAALSPAEISEIRLDKTNKKAEIIVENDQLSLAIGKHGQNVKLASKLVEWELDIRTKEQSAKEAEAKEAKKAEIKAAAEPPQAEEVASVAGSSDLSALPGVGAKTKENLEGAGFKSAADIAAASIEKLSEIKGIGKKKAATLIEEAKKIIGEK